MLVFVYECVDFKYIMLKPDLYFGLYLMSVNFVLSPRD